MQKDCVQLLRSSRSPRRRPPTSNSTRPEATNSAPRGADEDREHASVATTFSLALEKLETRDPAAAELIRHCAFLAPDAIPEEFFTRGAEAFGEPLASAASDPLRFGEAIRHARNLALLGRDPDAKTLAVHRLIQDVVRDRLNGEAWSTYFGRTVAAVSASFPDFRDVHEDEFARLLPHAIVCCGLLESINHEPVPAAVLLIQTGYCLVSRARFSDAEPLYRRALAACERALGPDHPDTAGSLNNLAGLLQVQGRYVEAEPMFRRALEVCERTPGPDYPHTAASLNNLAGLLASRGRCGEAEPLYRRALEILEKVLGVDHPNVRTVRQNLGLFLAEKAARSGTRDDPQRFGIGGLWRLLSRWLGRQRGPMPS